MKEANLAGKHAVVTGAASGIGEAIARCFAHNGASVTLLDVNAESVKEKASQLGAGCVGLVCDVTDSKSVSSVFEQAAKRGPVDILVNSAGIAHVGTLLSTAPEDFDRLFNVNVRGTYLCMQAAVAQMVEGKGGVILNIASIAATSGLADRFAYSMTKGAVLSMTLSVAKDYIEKKIRCNCISPARVHTPFVDGFVTKNYPGHEAEMYEKLAKSAPIGRMGKPDEIALLVQFLCSDASGFITGCDYPIDGGYFNLR